MPLRILCIKQRNVKWSSFLFRLTYLTYRYPICFLKWAKGLSTALRTFFFQSVCFLLLFRELWSTSPALVHNTIIDTLFTHVSFYVVTCICLVCKYGSFISAYMIGRLGLPRFVSLYIPLHIVSRLSQLTNLSTFLRSLSVRQCFFRALNALSNRESCDFCLPIIFDLFLY